MCYWLLPKSGVPISRTTIQAISPEELMTIDIQEQISNHDLAIVEKLGAWNEDLSHIKICREGEIDDDEEDTLLMEPDAKAPEVQAIEADAYDELLLTEPLLLER